MHTEIGSSMTEIMEDKTKTKMSLFESRVLTVVKLIIVATLLDVLVIFLVQGFARNYFTAEGIRPLILTCLTIMVASCPVALPLVMQVVMACGASKMAISFNAVVTSLPALQEISSMSILCSDKTGTLTTAKITIHAESVYLCGFFSKEDLALYAALASSRDKTEDAIDRSVINHFDKIYGPEGLIETSAYTKIRGVGFNPIYKRVLFEYSHATFGKVTIAKGLPAKVMNTADGEEDDSADQWVVENYDVINADIKQKDLDFSKAGYKTLGVSIKMNDGPFQFVGILPMLDPPRHDTAQTIKNITEAGIKIKMCTGDHVNIAQETARLVGLGVDIYNGSTIRDNSDSTNELILKADGFAQVLPRDKREVVEVLKSVYHRVVGMTGDGVNDAPALSAAQVGIAVDDATDAAKNAAAIILTSPGLSAIYSAVVESRRILRKLKSYVTYRFAASIQVSFLIFMLTLLCLWMVCISV
jgi:H+-transporting ATPase